VVTDPEQGSGPEGSLAPSVGHPGAGQDTGGTEPRGTGMVMALSVLIIEKHIIY